MGGCWGVGDVVDDWGGGGRGLAPVFESRERAHPFGVVFRSADRAFEGLAGPSCVVEGGDEVDGSDESAPFSHCFVALGGREDVDIPYGVASFSL